MSKQIIICCLAYNNHWCYYLYWIIVVERKYSHKIGHYSSTWLFILLFIIF